MTAASCFADAAASYDNHAQVQRWAAMHLLQRAQPQSSWLDIGCGTGFVSARLPAQQVIGVDIAMAMLQQGQGARLQGDMQALPLQSHSVAAVAANLSLQWSSDLSQSLREAARVCQPNGQLLFSVPAAGTFTELLPLVARGQLACNQFLSAAELAAQVSAAGWQQVQVQTLKTCLYFDGPKSLLQHFKHTGAQHAQRSAGLRGRQWWQQICTELEQYRSPQGLPLSWHIHLVEAKR
ncbi:methyltransferase domain-containing protein [uncultured Ferrimonas sp.]|uniref:methyltransferase domain-containing protein n=1 Tax=uncultured Ferrimonas sp. TaxID=432640 RepID=UPI002616DFD0|nr:methyltransferase domain-containing protein [uncultured Ferrimonas sp.]